MFFFFALVILAYVADIHNRKKNEEQDNLNDENKPVIEFDPVTIYR